MGRAGVAVAASAVALLAGGTAAATAADTAPPEMTKLRAHPKRFCVKRRRHCRHPGTTVKFNISTAGQVRADIRSRSRNTAPYVVLVKHFPAGANSFRLRDKRLTPGRWTLRLQGRNSVGSGGIALTDVHVVKKKK